MVPFPYPVFTLQARRGAPGGGNSPEYKRTSPDGAPGCGEGPRAFVEVREPTAVSNCYASTSRLSSHLFVRVTVTIG